MPNWPTFLDHIEHVLFFLADCLLKLVMQRSDWSSAFVDVVGRCGVVVAILAFGSIGHGFKSEQRLISHYSASAFSKMRSLAKCSLADSVR